MSQIKIKLEELESTVSELQNIDEEFIELSDLRIVCTRAEELLERAQEAQQEAAEEDEEELDDDSDDEAA